MDKILVLVSDLEGVGVYRFFNPHLYMQNEFEKMENPPFKVDIRLLMDGTLPLLNENFLKQYKIIFYNKLIPFNNPQHKMMFNMYCKKLNIKLIYDIDDYFILSSSHPNYKTWKDNNMQKMVEDQLISVDAVTTTTEIFAKELRNYNKNVIVLPNAINVDEQQWVKKKVYNGKKLSIGWLGGITHLHDLRLMEDSFKSFDKEILENIRLIMCGYDLRLRMPDGRILKDDPRRSLWGQFEDIFTNKGKWLNNNDYRQFLAKYEDSNFGIREEFMDEFYQRRWTRTINQYGEGYDEFDVALAPLKTNNSFNQMKCIVGDLLISTNNGIFYIKDIVDNKKELYSEINGNKNKIVNYFKYEKEKTLKITTTYGYSIEGTPTHRILINNKWVMLKDLKVGDNIELTKPEILNTEYKYITYPMLLTKNMTEEKILNSDKNMTPRIYINEDWGRLLGYILGDGSYGFTTLDICADKRCDDVVQDIMRLMTGIGLKPKVYQKKPDIRCKNYTAKEGFGVCVRATCVTFRKIAEKYKWWSNKGKNFRVPDVILESPKSVIKEFLRGLIESDGSVHGTMVSYCSKDLKLVEQVQYLLLSFNIKSKITKSYNKFYNRYYYNLILGRDASEMFYKEINFISEKKRTILENMCSKKHSNAFRKQVFNDDICKIEESINDVYDIEIDNVHSYNSNGIINHNSQLKLIEAGVRGIPLIASNFASYTLDDIDGKRTGKQKGILVDENDRMGWKNAIKFYLDNPNVVKEHGKNNYEYFMQNFSLDVVTKKRVELYSEMIK